jgi:hypothetical protein
LTLVVVLINSRNVLVLLARNKLLPLVFEKGAVCAFFYG